MTPGKRLFDLFFALLAAVLLAAPALLIALWILLRSGRPVFYGSERMRTPERAFRLWKFRTMTVTGRDDGVSGGDKMARITREGHILRRYRLDEIPQIWNIIAGDMSFVGPRPPLRQYTERYPDLYREVLRCRPGLTGLATLYFCRHEGWLLAQCPDREGTDLVYARRCVPRKARLDLIYRRNRTIGYDIVILCKTFMALLPIGGLSPGVNAQPPITPPACRAKSDQPPVKIAGHRT